MSKWTILKALLMLLLLSTSLFTIWVRLPSLLQSEDVRQEYSSESWVSFGNVEAPKAPEIQVLKSDEELCVLSLETFGVFEEEVKVGENRFRKLFFPGYGFVGDVGEPMLPAVRGFVEVPAGKSVRASATVLESRSLVGYNVYPFQHSDIGIDSAANKNEFQFDEKSYSADTYFPEAPVSVGKTIQLRDHTLVQVSMHPVRYNPVHAQLNVATHMNVELEFGNAGEACSSCPESWSSPMFDETLEGLAWNSGHEAKASQQQSNGYLIITHDDFYSELNSFIAWKESKGMSVTCVRLSDIAVNATDVDIQDYVRNAFYNWPLPPTYLLLVGDAEYVPVHYDYANWSRVIEDPTKLAPLATDNFYACVCGDDMFPDLFVGRLSVKNTTELSNVLEKIMGYNGFFNNKVTIMLPYDGQWAPGYDWYERDFVDDTLSTEGYDVNRLYYINGPHRNPDWKGNSTHENLVDLINNGTIITCYADHGQKSGWYGTLENSNICDLNNEGKYPLVLSLACLTGGFDEGGDCFGEALMKAPKKGAVAFWGASWVSEGPVNWQLRYGFFRALLNHRLNEFGPLTVTAKMHMFNFFGEGFDREWGQYVTNHTKSHIAMYNILTDPQLTLCQRDESNVCITEDGSVEPPVDNISKMSSSTYCFTGDVNGSIVVEKNDIVIDGNGYALQGSGKGHGIYLSSARNVTIRNLNIKGFVEGILIDFSMQNTFYGNNITDNYFGIWLFDSINNNLSQNRIANSTYGIITTHSCRWIPESEWETRITDNVVCGNVITNNCYAIFLHRVSRNTISENVILNNNYGLKLDWLANNNTVHSNTLANNCYAIDVEEGSENTISGNIIVNSAYAINLGLRVYHSNIRGNDISNNTYGICFNNSTAYNIVYGNNITRNNYGIIPISAVGNLVHHNNFIDNLVHVNNSGYIISWDDGFEGNYWDNYVGFDSDNDGIGDSAYIVGVNNIDNHPLMGLSQVFDCTSCCQVTVVSKSGVSNFTFETIDPFHSALTFNISGEYETQGFCRVSIPKALMIGFYVVKLDGETVGYPQFMELPCSKSEFRLLYMNCTAGEHTIEIVEAATPYPPDVNATAQVDPSILNLKGKGGWITTYIELPEDYSISDVNASTILFNGAFLADPTLILIGDYDNDSIQDLAVKFNRTTIADYILSRGVMTGNVTLTATGLLADGKLFAANATITVRMPGDINVDGKVDEEDVALTVKAFGSCPEDPRWNPAADENEDNKIDGKDVLIVTSNLGKTYT